MSVPENRLIVRFSDLEDARAALAEIPPGRPFLLVSAPGAAARLGARYLLAVARQAFPDAPPVIDCGDDVAAALDAIEAGAPSILMAPHPALEGLALARDIVALVWNRNAPPDLMP